MTTLPFFPGREIQLNLRNAIGELRQRTIRRQPREDGARKPGRSIEKRLARNDDRLSSLKRDLKGNRGDLQLLRKHLRVLTERLDESSARQRDLENALSGALSGAAPESRLAEYEQVLRSRADHLVEVDQPLMLISQIQRSGGTLLSQLFDGHPQLHAHPYELYIGHPDKYTWPQLDLDASVEQWFTLLSEPPTSTWFTEGYEKPGSPEEEAESLPCLLPPLLQKRIFDFCCDSRPVATQRDVLNCYMTSFFNAWLDNRNLHGPDEKKLVTAFLPRFHMKADNLSGFFADYPDGGIISIVRDPRSWYLSASEQARQGLGWGPIAKQYSKIETAIEAWAKSTRATLDAKDAHGGRVHAITFEALVTDTEGTMRGLAEFLGVEFHPLLLTPTFNGLPIAANSSFRETGSGILEAPTSRYMDHLSDPDIAYIEREGLPLYRDVAALVRSAV